MLETTRHTKVPNTKDSPENGHDNSLGRSAFRPPPTLDRLKDFPTVWRTCRHLQLQFTQEEIKDLGVIIRQIYNKYPWKKSQLEDGIWHRVYVYPESFVPEMIDIITEYHKMKYPVNTS